jgi:hypothetical protein
MPVCPVCLNELDLRYEDLYVHYGHATFVGGYGNCPEQQIQLDEIDAEPSFREPTWYYCHDCAATLTDDAEIAIWLMINGPCIVGGI